MQARRLPLATALALVGATACWWASLYPTLIPRGWIMQAVVSGVAAAIGYGIGAMVGRVVDRLGVRAGNGDAWRWIAVGIMLASALVAGVVSWPAWQNDLRDLVQMPHVGPLDIVPAVLGSVVLCIGLVVLGTWTARGIGALHRLLGRFLPGWLAAPATLVLLIALVAVVGGEVIWRGMTMAASAAFAPVDADTNPGTEPPSSATVSGSPDSLVSWESLGRWGRDFVAHATEADELAAFHGARTEVVEPVRVYVGLASAADTDARVELAVRELERTGGFERNVLAVWIPTGSGWVEPHAAESLEMLRAGDTAIVSVQYSYLPSLLAVLMDPHGSIETGLALFGAVRERWEELPEDNRPELVVFGMSMGTAGAEAPFAGADVTSSIANFVARTDGALMVGSKFHNEILTQLTDAREPGSPVWQPVVDDGETVRFVTRGPDMPPADPAWPPPRVIYLQHPSDPVTYWGIDHLWSPPEWMDQPRGHDVSEQATWFPIISGVAAVADLFDQLSTPPGFGHVYDHDYLDGWARVVPPDGWTDTDTRSLEDFLLARSGG